MRPEKLSEEEVSLRLARIPSWTLEVDSIVRQVVCADFKSAITLINRIGDLAEALDHHPDLLLHGWNKVRVTLSTHSAGGLTDLDFQLAAQIDALG